MLGIDTVVKTVPASGELAMFWTTLCTADVVHIALGVALIAAFLGGAVFCFREAKRFDYGVYKNVDEPQFEIWGRLGIGAACLVVGYVLFIMLLHDHAPHLLG